MTDGKAGKGIFQVRYLHIDTLSERVLFIHEDAVQAGNLGVRPLDRVQVIGKHPLSGKTCEVSGIVNFCGNQIIGENEIGLSNVAFRDLGLPEGTEIQATLAPAPHSLSRVRRKLAGQRLKKNDFEAILSEVVAHRYSKVELSMFVLACALRQLDTQEIIDFTQAMISTGHQLDFGQGPIADKHCIGGVPGNRTSMIIVPILASLGVTIPKTSSRAITSPAGTADTMSVLAEVALSLEEMKKVVSDTGGCIAWGGALELAPADDILITVERPMAMDTESQMVASILAKKKTAGATHALIDIPVGESAKIRTRKEAEFLGSLFTTVSQAIGIELEIAVTEARGPIGFGIGPRLEALDVLSVLRCDPAAPVDLREKSLFLAARILERVGAASGTSGYQQAQASLDSGNALHKFEEIRTAQGERQVPEAAPFRHEICALSDGRIRGIDCWSISKVAKLAGAPGNPSAGVLLRHNVGEVVVQGQAVYEIHAQSRTQLEFALEYVEANSKIIQLGY